MKNDNLSSDCVVDDENICNICCCMRSRYTFFAFGDSELQDVDLHLSCQKKIVLFSHFDVDESFCDSFCVCQNSQVCLVCYNERMHLRNLHLIAAYTLSFILCSLFALSKLPWSVNQIKITRPNLCVRYRHCCRHCSLNDGITIIFNVEFGERIVSGAEWSLPKRFHCLFLLIRVTIPVFEKGTRKQ